MLQIITDRKIASAIIFITILLLFSSSLWNEFVWDDQSLLKKDIFTDWKNIGTIFTVADTVNPGDNVSYYRPLAYITFLFDYQLWELNPFGYNLENILLHALVAILFYLLISKVFNDNVLAFLSSMLFAIHPAVTEPVNFIAGGRNTILCAAFLMGSLLLLVYSKGGKWKWSVFSVIVYSLSLLSKEQAITLPLFLLFMTILSKSEEVKVKGYLITGFFATTIVYLFFRAQILGVVTSQFDIFLSHEKLGLIASCLVGYFRIMLFPLKLNIEYMTVPLPLLSFNSIAAAGGMIALIYFSTKRNMAEPLRISCIWLVLSFLPISNIIAIPSAPVADRYIYIPLLGMCLAAGYLLKSLHAKKQTLATSLFIVLMVTLGTLTHARNNVWENEESLWMDVVKKSPAKAVGYFNLGVIYEKKGAPDRAIKQYRLALQKDPNYVSAYTNLGIIYHLQGLTDKALEQFRTAIQREPDFAKGYYNIGRVFQSRGSLNQAIEYYLLALSFKPDYAEAHNNLGAVYKSQNLIDKAIEHFQTSVKLNPKSANSHNNLGAAYMSKGRMDEAIKHFQIALAIDPNHAKAIMNLRFATSLKAY